MRDFALSQHSREIVLKSRARRDDDGGARRRRRARVAVPQIERRVRRQAHPRARVDLFHLTLRPRVRHRASMRRRGALALSRRPARVRNPNFVVLSRLVLFRLNRLRARINHLPHAHRDTVFS